VTRAAAILPSLADLENHPASIIRSVIYKRRALLSNELSENPYERLVTYLDMNVARLFEQSCKCSCLVQKLASEVATFSDDMRAVLVEGMREWSGFLEKLIVEGQEKGVIRKELDPTTTAALLQDLLAGSSPRSQLEHSVAPLGNTALFIREYLKPS